MEIVMSDAVPNSLSEVLVDFEKVPTLRGLQDKVDRLPISADAKSILMDVAKVTLAVGGKVIALGRKILAFAIELAGKFQNAIFGVIIALIISMVLAALPLLGPALSALLTPLMVALSVGRGAMEDFKNMSVQREIEGLKQRMSILAAHA
jgi:tetrahydromethanopterin S-methyltransferase subunit B